MHGNRTMVCHGILCLLLPLAFTPYVDAGALRPYAARPQKPAHHHSKPPQVAAPAVVAPVAARLVEPMAEAGPTMPSVAASAGSDDPQSYNAVKQLRSDLAEMKQMHGNVETLEKTLKADVMLLRESA